MSEELSVSDLDEKRLPGIPRSWAWVQFGSAFSQVSVVQKIPASSYLADGSLPVIDQGQQFIGGYTDDEMATIEPDGGFIVFGDHTRAFKKITFPFAAGADGIKVLKPSVAGLDYSFYACLALRFPNKGYARHYSHLRGCKVPIAPAAEQSRIVSKIDELFSSIDEGERALERVRKLVERYRQSVLKAAMTGELTREWREQHAGELESGEALLTRILEARRQAWETCERKQSGSCLRRTAEGRYKEPCSAHKTDPGSLPNGWTWATLDQLSYEGPTNGYSPLSEASSKGTLTLKLTATTSGKLRLDNKAVKRVDESIPEDSNLWLRDGDLLIQRANSYEHVGATALFAGPERTYIYPDLMMRIRLANPKHRSWVWRLLNSRDVRRYFQENATGTAGSMPKIGGLTVRKLALPMPPEEELTQLLSRLEQRLSECDQLLHEIQAFMRRISSLRQSILSHAFSGQLVPQDPTDEPASVLLERIAAERAAAPKRVSTKQVRTKKAKAKA